VGVKGMTMIAMVELIIVNGRHDGEGRASRDDDGVGNVKKSKFGSYIVLVCYASKWDRLLNRSPTDDGNDGHKAVW
jgi:hypothetical protein